mmetsp:Transcript_10086/g.22412  ORF Transcript_10086/g.22412 Transcript_10086/m.22412 type:complete len:128 (-) Transcript_10086:481-864(-)|eukprot:CAMPEP_0113320252 /NCGR_PEP_ID=MMETSP0010_2-20120614/14135_1 /TAXON_ID=216773 ORGANISM="Corethron hystrix, Strain 308" /NCGR_SAMPLE_ID=MMETSP0010_2 /ASSEMBLY_ACC=CAM_ASM_000155 /LENGTH=127 /DNA_ID=CAMNT_0000177997 /DNA_START=406 /DNA_END=789 /DNA_ORIENTATION=- /assembly_acc=CAM_ASM_000155
MAFDGIDLLFDLSFFAGIATANEHEEAIGDFPCPVDFFVGFTFIVEYSEVDEDVLIFVFVPGLRVINADLVEERSFLAETEGTERVFCNAGFFNAQDEAEDDLCIFEPSNDILDIFEDTDAVVCREV